MQATQLLVRPLRLGEVGAPEPVDGLWIDGLCGREVSPRGDDTARGSRCAAGHRPARATRLAGRAAGSSRAPGRARPRRPVEREQRGAGEEPGRPEGRIEPHGRTELAERVGVALLLPQDQAEIVVHEGPILARSQHVAECRLRRVEPPRLERRDAFREA